MAEILLSLTRSHSLTRQSWLGKYLNWRGALWLKVKLPLSGRRRSCSCLFIRPGAISIQLGCVAGTFGARPKVSLFFVRAHAAGVTYNAIDQQFRVSHAFGSGDSIFASLLAAHVLEPSARVVWKLIQNHMQRTHQRAMHACNYGLLRQIDNATAICLRPHDT